MEQYIHDWLKEHPEAREVLAGVWALGYADGTARAVDVLVCGVTDGAAPKNPFREEPQEVKAA